MKFLYAFASQPFNGDNLGNDSNNCLMFHIPLESVQRLKDLSICLLNC